MRLVRTVLAVLLLTASVANQARCTEAWAFEAFQPIWTDNDIFLSRVTVLTYNSGDVGVHAVLATCDSNQVMSDYGSQQRNAAFQVGLSAEVRFNSGQDPPLFGDTLRVVLRGARSPQDLDDHGYLTIVAATVKCILLNAAQSPAIRFVDLNMADETGASRHGGIHSTEGLRNGPAKREFVDR